MKFVKNREAELELVRTLSEQIAQLQGQISDLTRQKDRTAELRQLEDRVETAKREKGRLTEEHNREVRETEHRVGLLRKQQEQDVANAKRETELKVREENLERDKQRTEEQAEFMREQAEEYTARIDRILAQVMEKLPNVEATFARTDRTGMPAAPRRKSREEDDS